MQGVLFFMLIVILAIGLVFSLGAGAVIAAAVPVGALPLTARCALYAYYCVCGGAGFFADLMIWAMPFMLIFMLMALVVAIATRKKKGPDVVAELTEVLEEKMEAKALKLKNALEVKPDAGIGQELSQIKSTLNNMSQDVQDALERNKTVPLLQRMNEEAETAKTKMAVSLKEKCAQLTELSIENEKLEKKNYALRKVIDDALDPFCEKGSGEYRSNEYVATNDYRPVGDFRRNEHRQDTRPENPSNDKE